MLIDKERTVERRWELVLETAVNKAVEKGIKKGKEEAKEETITVLLQRNSMPVEEIATLMRVEIEEVLRIKNFLSIA